MQANNILEKRLIILNENRLDPCHKIDEDSLGERHKTLVIKILPKGYSSTNHILHAGKLTDNFASQ